jgi:hypothetical protein
LESFNFDDKTKVTKIDGACDSFNNFAKQVLSFKQSEHFKSVIPGESSLDAETRQVKFSIELTSK